MPDIEPRGKKGTLWMNFTFMGVRVHRSCKTTDEDLAKDMAKDEKRRIMGDLRDQRRGGQKSALRLYDVFQEYFDNVVKNTPTGQRRDTRYKILQGLVGDTLFKDTGRVTYNTLQREFERRQLSASRANDFLAFFNKAIEYANTQYDMEVPTLRRQFKKITKRAKGRAISDSEVEQIRDFFETWIPSRNRMGWSKRDRLEIFDVLVETGMRRGELFKFTVNDVNLRDEVITLDDHKTADKDGTRTIILSDAAVGIIRSRIERHGYSGTDRVFPYSPDAYTRVFKHMKKELGFTDPKLKVHSTRHKFATDLLLDGNPIQEVGQLLGHSTVTVTEMYSHVTVLDLKDRVKNRRRR